MITVVGSINLSFPVSSLPTPGQTLLAGAMTTEPAQPPHTADIHR